MTPRAAPLSPDERRRAIVEAVTPLLMTAGGEVSTRQIAEAAGVAEGTIFRAFPDKGSLMLAVMESVVDADHLAEHHAEAVADVAGLEDEVRATTAWLAERAEHSTEVMMALRRYWMSRPPEEHGRGDVDPRQVFLRSAEELHRVLTAMFTPYAARLAVPPETAAALLRTLVMGSRHPGADATGVLGVDEITRTLLHGIVAKEI